MKINRDNVKGVAGTYGVGAGRSAGKQASGQVSSGAGSADKVTVSDKARQTAVLKAKLQAAPDVRMELVERLKKQIQSGEYNVSPDKVAERILRSKVLDE